MAKVLHTCTGCVPIDVSIIDVYVALVKILKTIPSVTGGDVFLGDVIEDDVNIQE